MANALTDQQRKIVSTLNELAQTGQLSEDQIELVDAAYQRAGLGSIRIGMQARQSLANKGYRSRGQATGTLDLVDRNRAEADPYYGRSLGNQAWRVASEALPINTLLAAPELIGALRDPEARKALWHAFEGSMIEGVTEAERGMNVTKQNPVTFALSGLYASLGKPYLDAIAERFAEGDIAGGIGTILSPAGDVFTGYGVGKAGRAAVRALPTHLANKATKLTKKVIAGRQMDRVVPGSEEARKIDAAARGVLDYTEGSPLTARQMERNIATQLRKKQDALKLHEEGLETSDLAMSGSNVSDEMRLAANAGLENQFDPETGLPTVGYRSDAAKKRAVQLERLMQDYIHTKTDPATGEMRVAQGIRTRRDWDTDVYQTGKKEGSVPAGSRVEAESIGADALRREINAVDKPGAELRDAVNTLDNAVKYLQKNIDLGPTVPRSVVKSAIWNFMAIGGLSVATGGATGAAITASALTDVFTRLGTSSGSRMVRARVYKAVSDALRKMGVGKVEAVQRASAVVAAAQQGGQKGGAAGAASLHPPEMPDLDLRGDWSRRPPSLDQTGSPDIRGVPVRDVGLLEPPPALPVPGQFTPPEGQRLLPPAPYYAGAEGAGRSLADMDAARLAALREEPRWQAQPAVRQGDAILRPGNGDIEHADIRRRNDLPPVTPETLMDEHGVLATKPDGSEAFVSMADVDRHGGDIDAALVEAFEKQSSRVDAPEPDNVVSMAAQAKNAEVPPSVESAVGVTEPEVPAAAMTSMASEPPTPVEPKPRKPREAKEAKQKASEPPSPASEQPPSRFSRELADELAERNRMIADDGELPFNLNDDAQLEQLLSEIRDSGAVSKKAAREIDDWLIEKGVYREVSDVELANTVAPGGKKYDLQRGGKKYVFDRHLSDKAGAAPPPAPTAPRREGKVLSPRERYEQGLDRASEPPPTPLTTTAQPEGITYSAATKKYYVVDKNGKVVAATTRKDDAERAARKAGVALQYHTSESEAAKIRRRYRKTTKATEDES